MGFDPMYLAFLFHSYDVTVFLLDYLKGTHHLTSTFKTLRVWITPSG